MEIPKSSATVLSVDPAFPTLVSDNEYSWWECSWLETDVYIWKRQGITMNILIWMYAFWDQWKWSEITGIEKYLKYKFKFQFFFKVFGLTMFKYCFFYLHSDNGFVRFIILVQGSKMIHNVDLPESYSIHNTYKMKLLMINKISLFCMKK